MDLDEVIVRLAYRLAGSSDAEETNNKPKSNKPVQYDIPTRKANDDDQLCDEHLGISNASYRWIK